MRLEVRCDDDREREVVETLQRDWLLYGEIHITNANGVTRLDPRDITYARLDETVVDDVGPVRLLTEADRTAYAATAGSYRAKRGFPVASSTEQV